MKTKISNKEIENLIEKKFGEKPLKITDSYKGYDQVVKIVETKNSKYIFKFPRREKEIIKNQAFASKVWTKAGVPVPEVLFYSKDFLVESFTEGTPLEELKASDKEKKKIYFELGKLMKKMHSVKTKGYGNLKGKTKGEYKIFEDYVKWRMNLIENSREVIIENKLLSKKEIELLDKYIERKLKFSKKNQYVLCHQDLCEEHIFVKNGKISGIIDLADIKSEDPMSDFRRIAKFNDSFLNEVIKGYGKVSKDRIEIHRFILTMCNIPKCFRRDKPLRAKKFLKKLRSYISKTR
jgi:aminoglycoside phosphotransferase